MWSNEGIGKTSRKLHERILLSAKLSIHIGSLLVHQGDDRRNVDTCLLVEFPVLEQLSDTQARLSPAYSLSPTFPCNLRASVAPTHYRQGPSAKLSYVRLHVSLISSHVLQHRSHAMFLPTSTATIPTNCLVHDPPDNSRASPPHLPSQVPDSSSRGVGLRVFNG